MQPFFQTIAGEKPVSALFNNLGFLPVESSFNQAMALMNVSATNSKTSSGVIRDQIFHQCLFGGAASSVKASKLGLHRLSKSCLDMTSIVQGSVMVIMGVCGSGKTTIGSLLAVALNCTFLDADDFHPPSNKEKMREGIPLSEEDRMPWLQAISNALKEVITSGNSVVLACSALRKTYREILRSSDPNYAPGGCSSSVMFVLLDVPAEVLADRLHKRLEKGKHFMPPTLLQSQLELLEIDASEGVLQVDANQSPQCIVSTIQNMVSENRTS